MTLTGELLDGTIDIIVDYNGIIYECEARKTSPMAQRSKL